jgi:predicted ABC-type ATPase
MPTLFILAGPNGTGKTTFYSTAIESNLIEAELPFVNVDLITQQLGGYTEENFVRASEIYSERVGEHIKNKESFLIESNLADTRTYDWILLMKKNGYDVVLYFLSTDDVNININRVKFRVAEGGHDVAESIIKNRYALSHSYLKSKLHEFKEVFLIDNSAETASIEVRMLDFKITEQKSILTDWVGNILSIYKRLHVKK